MHPDENLELFWVIKRWNPAFFCYLVLTMWLTAHGKRKSKLSSKGIPLWKEAQPGRKPLAPSLWPPSFLRINFLPSFWIPQCLDSLWLFYTFLKLSDDGSCTCWQNFPNRASQLPPAHTITHTHRVTPERKGLQARAPGPWNHPTATPPAPANRKASERVMQMNMWP